MENKYTIEDLKTKKIAIHLPTEEEWNKLMEVFIEKDFQWKVGKIKDHPHYNGLYPCVNIHDETIVATGGYTYYKELGYTIITIDQLIDEPIIDEKETMKAERKTGTIEELVNEIKNNREKYDFIFQPKEEPIKKEFKTTPFWEGDLPMEETKELWKQCGDMIKETYDFTLENYPKGSRMWAFEMLDKGEKLEHGKTYIYIQDGILFTVNEFGNHVHCGAIFWKEDGWELYKEPEEKKTMTKEQAIEQNKSFRRSNGDEYYYGCASEGVCGYSKKGGCITNCINLMDIIVNPEEIVEIIEE